VLKRPPLHSTHWTGGFWQKQFELCTNTILPNIFNLFDSDDISHCIANFRIAAGTQEGTHKGPPFGDGDFYKWLEAASYIYGVTKDEKLKKRIDESIKLIASVQREDGYIFTQYSIKLKQGAKEEELGNSLNFEAYNLGHLITAACIHARTTGESTLLDLGIKAAHCLKALFEEAKKTHTAKTAICPSHYMALIDLYRLTGDITHLDTAELAIRLRDEVVGGTDDNQDRLKLADHTEMLGHAVRATYLYSGVADLVAEIGVKEYSEILMKVWESEEYTKMYINSGCGALFDGVSPSGFAGDHPNLARTHQAFGRPYQLPNLTGYNETCASIGNIFFNWRLLHLNAQAVHADRTACVTSTPTPLHGKRNNFLSISNGNEPAVNFSPPSAVRPICCACWHKAASMHTHWPKMEYIPSCTARAGLPCRWGATMWCSNSTRPIPSTVRLRLP
jgi:hypothetical protein